MCAIIVLAPFCYILAHTECIMYRFKPCGCVFYIVACFPLSFRKSFSEFTLDYDVVERLEKMGFSTTFEIQDKTLPLTLTGRYICVADWTVGGAWWLIIK